MHRLISVVAVLLLTAGGGFGSEPICGDMDISGGTDIADLVYLVDHMFSGGPPPPLPATSDCDGNNQLDISDLVCWIDCWFVIPWDCNPLCNLDPLGNHTDISGQCLRGPGADGAPASPRGMYVEAMGNDLHVYHPDAYYQCCLGYHVQYYQNGNHFVGFETDTNEQCDCYCPFDLESIIHDLTPGEYVVTLYGIEGDLVGVDTAVIAMGLIDFGDSGCLDLYRDGALATVNYYYSGDTLTMEHLDGYFNCGGIIEVQFDAAGDTLRFREFNISEDWLFCMCHFAVSATVVGVTPGTYVIEVYARDWPDDPIALVDRRTVVLEP